MVPSTSFINSATGNAHNTHTQPLLATHITRYYKKLLGALIHFTRQTFHHG